MTTSSSRKNDIIHHHQRCGVQQRNVANTAFSKVGLNSHFLRLSILCVSHGRNSDVTVLIIIIQKFLCVRGKNTSCSQRHTTRSSSTTSFHQVDLSHDGTSARSSGALFHLSLVMLTVFGSHVGKSSDFRLHSCSRTIRLSSNRGHRAQAVKKRDSFFFFR